MTWTNNLEVVAWGLRNPYCVGFTPDGRLFATEHGMDERGARYVVDDPDDFYEIREGEWYGWPDFASGIRLDDPYWGEGGHGREPVLAEFPNPRPPKPIVSFLTHVAANGFDSCRNPDFGFGGDAFVACFGDLAPITTVTKAVTPAGFKVVRVDTKMQEIYDFAVNKMTGPASKLPHDGFEPPSHCQFGPDGALYIADFGIIHIAPERGGIRQQMWHRRPVAHPPCIQSTFDPDRAMLLRAGRDVTLVSTGYMTQFALPVADELRREGVSVELLHYPSVKPFDAATLVASRPTAVNLAWAVDRMMAVATGQCCSVGSTLQRVHEEMVVEALRIEAEGRDACAAMAAFGRELVPDGANVLTTATPGCSAPRASAPRSAS